MSLICVETVVMNSQEQVRTGAAKNRTPGHLLNNNGSHLHIQHAQYVLLFFVLVVNFNRFQILQSYMLLIKLPVLICTLELYMQIEREIIMSVRSILP